METATMKIFMDPEYQSLGVEYDAISESNQVEVYLVMW